MTSKYSLTSQLLAEFLGTMVLMIFGLGAILIFHGDTGVIKEMSQFGRLFGIGVGFAMGIVVVASSELGRMSGAQLNPAVSLWAFLEKKISVDQLLLYIASQVVGSCMAVGLYVLFMPDAMKLIQFGVTKPSISLGWSWAFINEWLITMALLLTIKIAGLKTGWTKYAAWMVGLVVIVCVVITAPISGASINPARSLGPALISGDMDYVWIYILAPLLAAVSAWGIRVRRK